MGDRGSKSVIYNNIIVKEQRVDGSSRSSFGACLRSSKSRASAHFFEYFV